MNIQTANERATRFVLVAVVAAGMLLFISTTPGFGQKGTIEAQRATSRDGLIDTGYLTKPDVFDELDGSDDEYFYKFQAGPGKLTVTLEVVANETNAGAMLDLFGINSTTIVSNVLAQGVDGGSERVSKSVNLAKAQDIIIRIKGLRYGSSSGYTGIYKIRLDGTAVTFKGVPPFADTGQETQPNQASTDKTDQNKMPDVPPADATGQDKPTATPSDETGQNNKPDVPPSDATGQDKPTATPPDGTGQNKKPDVPPLDATGQDKPTATPPDETGQNKKPDPVDRAIEKGKAKSKKFFQVLDKVKAKIPDQHPKTD